MKRWKVLLLCLFMFLLGIVLTLFWLYVQGSKVPTNWFVFDSSKESNHLKGLIGITSEALLDTDPDITTYPEINRVELRAKFKEVGGQQIADIKLGYILKITMDKLDKKNVSEKYLKKLEKHKMGTGTISPLDEIVIGIKVYFAFKDNDGFEIYRTKPIDEMATSGTTEIKQGITPDSIPQEIVQKTKYVEPHIGISTCLTCGPD